MATLNPPLISQPFNSRWCWAASMASLVSYELGLSCTCKSLVTRYTSGPASMRMVQKWLKADFNLRYRYIQKAAPDLALKSLESGHPVYAGCETSAGGHASVLCGLDMEAGTVLVMEPYCADGYVTGKLSGREMYYMIPNYFPTVRIKHFLLYQD